MIVFPNAKINLGLNVICRRPDGYHDLETVFYPIPLCDALEVVPAPDGRFAFTQSGLSVDGDPDCNLVVKAFRLLERDFDLPPVHVFLHKHIPMGAGLGGGSSDAAFMLKLMNDFAKLNISEDDLEKYASQLGADCPFFIRNRPVFAEGVGNIFSPLDVALSGKRIVVVKPDIHVSTGKAYSRISPRRPTISVREVVQKPVHEWRDLLTNDFEPAVFDSFPRIAKVKKDLYAAGALFAGMTGSGSAVFGLFEGEANFNTTEMCCFSLTLT